MSERTMELHGEDEPMERARNMFRAMGMGIRTDEIGELLLRRAADIIEIYRRLDRGAKP